MPQPEAPDGPGPVLRVDDEIDLRSVKLGDAEELFRLVDVNRSYLRRWLPWLDASRSADDIRNFIRESQRRAEEGRGLVVLIRHGDRLCGVAGFNWIDPAERSCEIGYWLGEEWQGRGIVTRSVRALIDYAFAVRRLDRVAIPVALENHKSRAIPERLGFEQEGVRRQAEWLYDQYVDHVVYVMRRRDP